MGPSYGIGRKANLVFQDWLPTDWIPRAEEPDFHIDYSIEVVRDGEPTGLIFRAQIKGRASSKRRPNHIVEQFETKHLRYYLSCPHPVYLFVIDPKTRTGFWLFIQRYLHGRGISEEQLLKQTTLKVGFDSRWSLDATKLFDQDLMSSWAYMRNQFPGTPTAAISAKQRELEQIDDRFTIKIDASENKMVFKLHSKAPIHEPTLKFLPNVSSEKLRAFFEKGESFSVKASELTGEVPILKNTLSGKDESEVIVTNADRFSGCVQAWWEGDLPENLIQVSGNWLIAPQRIYFEGMLPESPLKVSVSAETEQPGKIGAPNLTFGFDFAAWEGQPLLSLSHFDDLIRLTRSSKLSLRYLIRGGQLFRGHQDPFNLSSQPQIGSILGWLTTCRKVAAFVRCNPVYPERHHLSAFETNDMRFLGQMIEEGKHEQPYADEDFEMVGDIPIQVEPGQTEVDKVQMPGQFREVDFLGMKTLFGPLTYTWTDLLLISVEPGDNGPPKLKWRGTASSKFCIELTRESAPFANQVVTGLGGA
ncbi:MAG: DUF4365 domain-containing protein [Methylacidiphilales bacterium]|nr:DUF4365 domain-containing protein [Candidatus Methylacidiphilales bacterium]